MPRKTIANLEATIELLAEENLKLSNDLLLARRSLKTILKLLEISVSELDAANTKDKEV